MIKEPILLSFSLGWIVICLIPKKLYWRSTLRPVEWPTRVLLTAIGVATFLFWYSLPSA